MQRGQNLKGGQELKGGREVRVARVKRDQELLEGWSFKINSGQVSRGRAPAHGQRNGVVIM